jgi:hypothetical protein
MAADKLLNRSDPVPLVPLTRAAGPRAAVTGREVPAHSDLFVLGRVTLALSRDVADRAPRLQDPDRSRRVLAAAGCDAGPTCRTVG